MNSDYPEVIYIPPAPDETVWTHTLPGGLTPPDQVPHGRELPFLLMPARRVRRAR